jgi:hypothetical protein
MAAAFGVAQADATTLPGSPTEIGSHAVKIRPHSIVFTGDGTGLIAGIAWTRWNSSTAIGSGGEQINDCNPSCASAIPTGYPVKIEQWRPRTLGRATVFTRMTIWYTGSRPKGEPKHYTFTNVYSSGTYAWSPPGRDGYCIHTDGQKADPSCVNIGALPPK